MSNELFKAVRYALYAGTTAVVGLSAAPAFAQDDSTQKLDTITVTGSNIRRVDIETSNPVITVDRAEIQKSGKLTVGDLLQQLPTIAGAANNPNVNNGGGTGGSFISLRGLGSNRSLILLDGKRLLNNDVNAIPSAAIERIEVLTDGASAVYGSDAIAGVVNFITRKDYQGAELQMNYGISDQDDGARRGFSLTFGQTSDKGSLIGGIDYNKTDQILAGHRDFSNFALNFSTPNGVPTVTQGGSFTGPGGFFAGVPQFANCSYYGYGTTDPSAAGGNGIPAGFRCYVGSAESSTNDNYNYAPINLITVPQERANFFLNGSYTITDSTEAYIQVFHDTTRSAAQLAALPIDLAGAGLTVSADNPYNPVGVDIGAGADGDFGVRLTGLGPRIVNFNTTTDQARVGIKGNIFDTSWQYDLWGNYGHTNFVFHNINYFNAAGTANALSGDCTMPVAGEPLTTATCLNIFDQTDPVTGQLLHQYYSLNVDNGGLSTERQGGLDVNGTLFDLPAGSVGLAAGANYRKFYTRRYADTVLLTDPITNTCAAGSASLCSNPFTGSYNLKELYVEAFVPVLRDLPFVHSLNFTLGDRWSKYSTFGSTNNWKLAVEYRPIEDLLLRATVSKVFRAPNTSELFTGLSSSYDPYTFNPAFNEPRSVSNKQIQTIFSGAAIAGFPIKPENGKSFDFGVVYDPQWLPGLSVSADLWRIYLLDNIQRPSGQTIVDLCYSPTSAFDPNNIWCSYLNFNTSGAVQTISGVSVLNLGRLDVTGVDFAAVYKLPETAFGNFSFGLNATYLTKYNNTVPANPTSYVAGTYDQQFGSFPRWRALGSISWQMGDFSANWQQRFIGREKNTAGTFAGLPGGFLPIGGVTYHNVSFGYNIEPINTRIDIGVDNVGDKQPPFFYNSVTNANIDINTYDPVGRYYWGRVTVKF
jgi:outer membrane receptor protein involved in Fe transport